MKKDKDLVELIEIWQVNKSGEFMVGERPVAYLVNGRPLRVFENFAVEIKQIPREEIGKYFSSV